jgi:uncharacterized protein YqgV (UPF0045/DUF77 family)
MKNLLIVESVNDKFFVEALIQHLNLKNIAVSDGFIYKINDFETLDGLNPTKLLAAVNAVKSKIKKEDIQKVGILLDIDNETIADRLSLVNTALQSAFGNDTPIENINTFITIPIDKIQDVSIGAYFTNVEGQGELETVLRTIKSEKSVYADCLQRWQNCLLEQNNGIGLKTKDFDKFWVQMYIRYDTCTKKEQKQAGSKCNNEAGMQKPIWNFDHDCLKELLTFLALLNT